MAVIDYSLYLITDRDLLAGRDLLDEVRKAVRGGVTMVQLREKQASSREFYQQALLLKNELDGLNVPLIINDRLDIALAVGAAGLHIGQEDLPFKVALALMPAGSIIGVSVNTIEEAWEARGQGAAYLGVGPVFPTSSKADASAPIGIEYLHILKQQIDIPLVAIGGISEENLASVKESGVDGVAVISALMGKPDIEAAARRMMQIWRTN